MNFRIPQLLTSVVLSASLLGCVAAPKGLNLETERHTDKNTYVVAIKPVASPIVINKIHAWEIKVNSTSGAPVTQAKIDVGGGMPQHLHGFPTKPRVTKELGDGRYVIDGVKFSMPGWWEIKLDIDSPAGVDTITFNTVIEAK